MQGLDHDDGDDGNDNDCYKSHPDVRDDDDYGENDDDENNDLKVTQSPPVTIRAAGSQASGGAGAPLKDIIG